MQTPRRPAGRSFYSQRQMSTTSLSGLVRTSQPSGDSRHDDAATGPRLLFPILLQLLVTALLVLRQDVLETSLELVVLIGQLFPLLLQPFPPGLSFGTVPLLECRGATCMPARRLSRLALVPDMWLSYRWVYCCSALPLS